MAGPDKNPVPGPAGFEQKQCNLLRQALSSSDISTGELWLRYFGIGGSADPYDVDAYLQSLGSLPTLQRDLLAHAANELIDELLPPLRAPYLDDLTPPLGPGQGPGQGPRPSPGPPPQL